MEEFFFEAAVWLQGELHLKLTDVSMAPRGSAMQIGRGKFI